MSRVRSLAPALLLALAACAHAPAATPPPPDRAAPEAAEGEGGASADAEVLPWIHDDWEGALAEARTRGVPVFVDLWAPWCHTCISMQKYVFVDPALKPWADRFVWLALDADKPGNAAAVGRLRASAMPTFYVVSPVDGSVQARFTGSASLSQLRSLLAQGERGTRESQGDALDPASPLFHVRAGDRAAAAGDLAAADAAYEKALAAAPADWPRRPEVLVALIGTHYEQQDFEGCARLGLAHLGEVAAQKTASAADFTYYAVTCAEHVDDPALAERIRRRAVAPDGPLHAVIDDPGSALSLDDRSDALRILREVHLALGEKDLALKAAEAQRALADRAAAEAPDDFARMLWNWPRSEVYVFLGRGAELIPDLEASVKALPNEYDPPYRLAWVLLKTGGDLDRAAALARRAADLAYGPRKARVLGLLAAVEHARGDASAERAARRAVVDTYAALPEGQKRPAAEAQARAALEAMDAAP